MMLRRRHAVVGTAMLAGMLLCDTLSCYASHLPYACCRLPRRCCVDAAAAATLRHDTLMLPRCCRRRSSHYMLMMPDVTQPQLTLAAFILSPHYAAAGAIRYF